MSREVDYMNKKSKIILITVIILVIAVCTTAGFALWTGALNPETNVTLKAGTPVEIVFGSASEISEEISPGKTVTATANINSVGKELNVTYKIKTVRVKLSGSDEFIDVTNRGLFTMTTAGGAIISNEATHVTFSFKMDSNVSADYVKAEFEITVSAIGNLRTA